MEIIVREYQDKDLQEMIEIWNEVVKEGDAFPQFDLLTAETGKDFFAAQSFTGVAVVGTGEDEQILGLYILHPNNVGRCGHISNASYAVKSSARGMKIGEQLVKHCLEKGKEIGFRILQFNAVVKTNLPALQLYEKMGFVRIGEVKGGFLKKDGSYEDIVLFYHVL